MRLNLIESDALTALEAFLHALQLGAVDAWTLFTSLDKDGDFEVSVDERLE